MDKRNLLRRKLIKNKQAISPAISTVILTSAVVVLLLVTIVFANTFLDGRLAENEFETMKQFMQTLSLQLDDVAWTIGRTQTIRYATRSGQVGFESLALNYTVYVDHGDGYEYFMNNGTGIVLFNIPISQYSVKNDFYEHVYPSTDSSFLQEGTSAPICHVYVIEKIPMNDGNFIRVVAAPSIRMLNSTISTGGESKNYIKLYFPHLKQGSHPRKSQSITLTGDTVFVNICGSVNRIKVEVSFPKSGLGFDSTFFRFESLVEEVDVPDNSVLEVYIGEVIVSIGLHV